MPPFPDKEDTDWDPSRRREDRIEQIERDLAAMHPQDAQDLIQQFVAERQLRRLRPMQPQFTPDNTTRRELENFLADQTGEDISNFATRFFPNRRAVIAVINQE